ncbi:amidohydrolase [Gorillibacterium massiliense]|uniref:amidohydrolase n=1 Tax=Gorillibacterium massiliense TaxID=1280390 RepID=UPI0004ADDF00|nr:amidohydrolase [Gorillibacterium massiliense]
MSGTLFLNGRRSDLPRPGRDIPEDLAVYAENGIIRAVGSGQELRLQLTGRDYRTVDWEGGYVLPGLADSHMHLSMHGMKLAALDFSEARSKDEMLELLRQRAETTSPGEWILGLNWNENAFTPAVAPTIDELDAVTERHPVMLTRVCFHAYLANSEAFRRAGLTEGAPDPESGAYGRDAEGRFNGMVYEDAAAPFQKVLPEPDYAAKKECIRRASLDALRLGLTASHTDDLRFLGSLETMLRIYRELREEGVLLRTNQLVYYPFLEEAAALGLKAGSGDSWLKIGAAKVFADGVLGGRTALLSKPYADDPGNRGIAIHSQEGLNAIVAKARETGLPMAVHAIGDEAAAMTLNALELHSGVGVTERYPDRLIHALVLRPDLVERMARLPLAADIQPHFVVSDFPWALERMGDDRREYLYAWRKLLAAGIPCAGGSDAPIEPLNPFLGLHAAVARRRPGVLHDGYLPQEKLTLAEAVDLFTVGSAYIEGEAAVRGKLAVGYAADFTVVDRDIFALADRVDELADTEVQMTVVNGETAYSRH